MATDPTGMSCKELVELITEYIEGTLPELDRARFDQHLAFCDWCRTYLDQMRLTVQTLGKLTEDTIAEQTKSDLLAVFRDWEKS